MRSLYLFLSLTALLVLAGPGRAANYYVSGSGSDTNAGTGTGSAFKTLVKAAGTVQAGDTVFVMTGTYSESVRPAVSGTAGKPIVYTAYGDGEVVLTHPSAYVFRLTNLNHYVINGFTFRNAYAWIHLEGGAYHAITNCIFDGSQAYHCLFVNNSSYNTIIDCQFIKARDGAPDTNHADYIPIYGSSHYNLVQSCTFGWITHVGISIEELDNDRTPSHNIIRKCYFKDPGWKPFGIYQSEYTLIEQNECTGTAGSFIQLQGPKTIIRHNKFHNQRVYTGRNEPYWDGTLFLRTQNAFEHTHYNMQIPQHNRIYHNVFYNNDLNIVVRPYLQRASSSSAFLVLDNIFMNNIFYKNGEFIYLNEGGSTVNAEYRFDNNAIFGMSAGQTSIHLRSNYTLATAEANVPEHFTGNYEVEPVFVNADIVDFRLQTGSPCINKGKALARTVGSGTGKIITVTDAFPFCDGYGVIPGDEIKVGSNDPVAVFQVDYFHKTLIVNKEITWGDNDPVSLTWLGTAPDLGIYEYGDDNVRISSAAFPNGTEGRHYNARLDAVNTTGPCLWQVIGGALPAGLGMDQDGEVRGIPAAAGTYTITVLVTDSLSQSHSRSLDLLIDPAPAAVIGFEAEDGWVKAPLTTGTDAAASGGGYLDVPAGIGETTELLVDLWPEAACTVNTPSSGEYYIWVSVYGTGPRNRKVNVKFNHEQYKSIYPLAGDALTYAWVKLNGASMLYKGVNVFKLIHQQDNVRVDRVVLALDEGYDPAGSPIRQDRADRAPAEQRFRIPRPATPAYGRQLTEQEGMYLYNASGYCLQPGTVPECGVYFLKFRDEDDVRRIVITR